MGYSTDYIGKVTLNRVMDADTAEFLTKLNNTRRMKRKGLDPKYGIEGEFYVEDDEKNVIDINTPPSTQPGLWNHWKPTEDLTGLEWDGVEKTYEFDMWLTYIIDKILAPKGFIANGTIEAQGEETEDHFWITVKDNVVSTRSTKELQANLSAAEERVKLLETPTEDLPTLINQVWVDQNNKDLYDRLLKNQKEHNKAIELLQLTLTHIESKTLKSQITKYLKKGRY